MLVREVRLRIQFRRKSFAHVARIPTNMQTVQKISDSGTYIIRTDVPLLPYVLKRRLRSFRQEQFVVPHYLAELSSVSEICVKEPRWTELIQLIRFQPDLAPACNGS